jgi:acetyltransferase-like isoleucine patch superfamily enzyme
MNLLKKITNFYWHHIASPLKYAKHIGVNIGNNCFISTRGWSSEPYLITVGNNVQITQNVYIHTHGGAHVARTIIPKFDVFGKVKICDNAYIGSGSHIMPGVTIGAEAMIAAGSVVCKSVPARQLWGGVPASFICSIDDYIARNQKYNVNTKGLSFEQKKEILLSLSDDMFITK